MTNTQYAFRSSIFYFIDDPYKNGELAYRYLEDGLMIIQGGHIHEVGDYNDLRTKLTSNIPLEEYPNHMIMPGFVDTHIHYPQTQIIAAYGEQLLEWLNNYTFPAEQAFESGEYASKVSTVFLDELLRNGVTTAMVFGTVHKASVDAFFSCAQKRNLRMIAGKVMMDRNAPAALCDTADSAYEDSKALIERWHGIDRLEYAITPRFAPTSSAEQLSKAAQLLDEYPDVYMQTHLSENKQEIDWVKSLFPNSDHYLGVYSDAGLVRRRSIFAHCLHLCDDEWSILSDNQANIAHCPTSNLFLGSGLFDFHRAKENNIHVGLGTDVGAGTSFSIFKTLDEAYKIQQLRGKQLNPFNALYMATLGGARALDLDKKIGSLEKGKEADFIVLDLEATPLLKFRRQYCQSLSELLFTLNSLGDDRLIKKTFACGRCVHDRDTVTGLH